MTVEELRSLLQDKDGTDLVVAVRHVSPQNIEVVPIISSDVYELFIKVNGEILNAVVVYAYNKSEETTIAATPISVEYAIDELLNAPA